VRLPVALSADEFRGSKRHRSPTELTTRDEASKKRHNEPSNTTVNSEARSFLIDALPLPVGSAVWQAGDPMALRQQCLGERAGPQEGWEAPVEAVRTTDNRQSRTNHGGAAPRRPRPAPERAGPVRVPPGAVAGLRRLARPPVRSVKICTLSVSLYDVKWCEG
jgi:hypothetical protein